MNVKTGLRMTTFGLVLDLDLAVDLDL